MDSVLPSTDSAAKTSGLAGLLSSLGSVFNTGAAGTGAFARFLEQNQGTRSSSTQSTSSAPSVQTTVAQNSDSDSPGSGSLLHTLKTAISDVRHVLHQLNGNDDNKAPPAKTRSSDTSQGSTPSPTAKQAPAQNTQTQTQSQTTDQGDGSDDADAAVTGGVNGNPATATNPVTGAPVNTPPAVTGDATVAPAGDGSDSDGDASLNAQTIAQLMSELVTLMQMVEKKLIATQTPTAGDGTNAAETALSTDPAQPVNTVQAAGPADGSALANLLAQPDATTAAGNTGTDPSSGSSPDGQQASDADPLTQLLTLIQSIEQKLAPASSDAPQTNGPVTAAATPAAPQTQNMPIVFPDFTRIQKDLKQLVTSLQNTTANNNPQVDTASGDDAGNAVTAQGTNDSTLVTGLLLKTADTSPAAKAPVLAGNLLNLFNDKTGGVAGNLSAPNNISSATAANMAAAPQNSLLDSSAQNDDATSSDSNAAGLTANNTPLPTLPDGTKAVDPYSFASQLSATRAMTGGTTGLPSAVEQVLLQLNRGVKNGNDQMTIQLQPGDLGKINIKLDIASDGKVQGTVMADNPATLNLLLKDVRSLERALQEAGLRADPGSLQFSLGGQSGNPGQTANNSGNGQSSDNGTSSGTSLDMAADAGETWIVSPGRVNLKV